MEKLWESKKVVDVAVPVAPVVTLEGQQQPSRDDRRSDRWFARHRYIKPTSYPANPFGDNPTPAIDFPLGWYSRTDLHKHESDVVKFHAALDSHRAALFQYNRDVAEYERNKEKIRTEHDRLWSENLAAYRGYQEEVAAKIKARDEEWGAFTAGKYYDPFLKTWFTVENWGLFKSALDEIGHTSQTFADSYYPYSGYGGYTIKQWYEILWDNHRFQNTSQYLPPQETRQVVPPPFRTLEDVGIKKYPSLEDRNAEIIARYKAALAWLFPNDDGSSRTFFYRGMAIPRYDSKGRVVSVGYTGFLGLHNTYHDVLRVDYASKYSPGLQSQYPEIFVGDFLLYRPSGHSYEARYQDFIDHGEPYGFWRYGSFSDDAGSEVRTLSSEVRVLAEENNINLSDYDEVPTWLLESRIKLFGDEETQWSVFTDPFYRTKAIAAQRWITENIRTGLSGAQPFLGDRADTVLEWLTGYHVKAPGGNIESYLTEGAATARTDSIWNKQVSDYQGLFDAYWERELGNVKFWGITDKDSVNKLRQMIEDMETVDESTKKAMPGFDDRELEIKSAFQKAIGDLERSHTKKIEDYYKGQRWLSESTIVNSGFKPLDESILGKDSFIFSSFTTPVAEIVNTAYGGITGEWTPPTHSGPSILFGGVLDAVGAQAPVLFGKPTEGLGTTLRTWGGKVDKTRRHYEDQPLNVAELAGEALLWYLTKGLSRPITKGIRGVNKYVGVGIDSFKIPGARGAPVPLLSTIHRHGKPIISWSSEQRNPLKKTWRRGAPVEPYKDKLSVLEDIGPGRNIGEWTRGGPAQRIITQDDWQRELVKRGIIPESHSIIMKDRQFVTDVLSKQSNPPVRPVTSLNMKNIPPGLERDVVFVLKRLQDVKAVGPLHGSATTYSYLDDIGRRAIGTIGDFDAPAVWGREAANPFRYTQLTTRGDKVFRWAEGWLQKRHPDFDIKITGVGERVGRNRNIQINGEKILEQVFSHEKTLKQGFGNYIDFSTGFWGGRGKGDFVSGHRLSDKTAMGSFHDISVRLTGLFRSTQEHSITSMTIQPRANLKKARLTRENVLEKDYGIVPKYEDFKTTNIILPYIGRVKDIRRDLQEIRGFIQNMKPGPVRDEMVRRTNRMVRLWGMSGFPYDTPLKSRAAVSSVPQTVSGGVVPSVFGRSSRPILPKGFTPESSGVGLPFSNKPLVFGRPPIRTSTPSVTDLPTGTSGLPVSSLLTSAGQSTSGGKLTTAFGRMRTPVQPPAFADPFRIRLSTQGYSSAGSRLIDDPVRDLIRPSVPHPTRRLESETPEIRKPQSKIPSRDRSPSRPPSDIPYRIPTDPNTPCLLYTSPSPRD